MFAQDHESEGGVASGGFLHKKEAASARVSAVRRICTKGKPEGRGRGHLTEPSRKPV